MVKEERIIHNDRTVFVYTYVNPGPAGSGAQIRVYTNIRAYLDLGMSVKVFHITHKPNENICILPDGAEYFSIKPDDSKPTLWQRIAYKIGFPFKDALFALYPDRSSILRVVLENERTSPKAIHHFEYPSTANVVLSLKDKNLNLVWSCHDWESDRFLKIAAMRAEAGIRRAKLAKIHRQYYVNQIEKRIADASKLVLMIAEHETRIFRDQLNITNAELLPMSWPDETIIKRTRNWVQDGKLRMLHVGSPDAMVGYYSLKFLLAEVFPLMPERVRQQIELLVVGKIDNSSYFNRILELASHYPQVTFLGYVNDIKPFYAQCDIQLVGNRMATGLRTRIIESFVFGVPVVSVPEAALGIIGLVNGKNIYLENSPQAIADRITQLLENPDCLPTVAANGRDLYEKEYSRKKAADLLKNYLNRYIFRENNA